MNTEQLRSAYDAVAAEYAARFYDELHHKPFDCKMLDWVIERVGSGGSILDLGCGPGHVAAYLHQRKARVCGIDLSEQMVRQARLLNPDVRFKQGDMLSLETVSDASFDGIVAFYSLVNFNNREVHQALRQIRRIIGTVGVLLLAVHLGEGTVQVDSFLDQDVSLQFTLFDRAKLRHHLETAGFVVTEAIERDPYADHEYPSRRLYIFATPSNACPEALPPCPRLKRPVMHTTFALRPVALEELPICADFWLAMFEEVGKHREAEFRSDWRERFVDYFRRRIQDGEAAYIVADDAGRIVGTAGAMVADGYPAVIHGIHNGYIFGVRVEPAYRGGGLATSLTREAIAFLRSKACARIRLHASPFGRPIYDRLGFETTNEMGL